MATQTALSKYLDQLPPDWKWNRSFNPPPELAAEWQTWLANAQRAELDATLRYWAVRSRKTAQ